MQKFMEIGNHMNEGFEAIRSYLGEEADYLLNFNNPKISKESIHIPGPDFIDRILVDSEDRKSVV